MTTEPPSPPDVCPHCKADAYDYSKGSARLREYECGMNYRPNGLLVNSMTQGLDRTDTCWSRQVFLLRQELEAANGGGLFAQLSKALVRRIMEADANCDPPTDVALRLESIIRERDYLRAWKDSQMSVEREWDVQALAKLCGANPGESCRVAIDRFVRGAVTALEKIGSIRWDFTNPEKDARQVREIVRSVVAKL